MLRKNIKNIFFIIAGSVLYAAGISLFLSSNQLASGGVTGIAVILSHITGLSTGTLTLVINIPLLILGIWKLGLKFFLSTVITVIISSVLINILEPFGSLTDDLLLAALSGGALVSTGMGLIFKTGATTGGSDIVVRLLRIKFKHIKTGQIFLITDSVVIALSAAIFRNLDIALYAALTVIIQSFVLDTVLYGTDGERLVYIISDHHREIADIILEKLSIGATYIEGYGAFSSKNKKIILCAMRKQLLPQIRQLVNDTDKNAFMIVTSASEIFGEGFKEYDHPEI